MDIPRHLKHKPIIAVNYEEIDEAGDAKYISIGRAQWDNSDLSAKVFRYDDKNEKWSRQSEEIPLWRVLDLAKLVIASITSQQSDLNEQIIEDDDKQLLHDYIMENFPIYASRIKGIQHLIQSSLAFRQHTPKGDAPNLFSFATSELSQDAILSWMLQWSSPKYKNTDKELHDLSLRLIRRFLNNQSFEIDDIEVGRQWKNIDIWAEINDDTFLLIEDKTSTSIHDNQIERYKRIVEEEYAGKRKNLCYIYLKTGNEPLQTLRAVEKVGYKCINRQDLLNILDTYKGNNAIVGDFREYLQEIEDKTNGYLTKPLRDWDGYSWEGFYKFAETKLQDLMWSYVANPSGGFIGGWWHSQETKDDVEIYLQFEESRLCFKINCEGLDNKSLLRDKYIDLLTRIKGEEFPEITPPYRRGIGNYMTIGIVEVDAHFTKDGFVDFDKLFDRIKKYEDLVLICSAE